MDALKSTSGVEAIVIQESPYKQLPEWVARVLDSRPLTYAADGMLYLEELASQASAIGLVVHRFPRKSDQIAAASQARGASASEVATILPALVSRLAPPGGRNTSKWLQRRFVYLEHRTEGTFFDRKRILDRVRAMGVGAARSAAVPASTDG